MTLSPYDCLLVVYSENRPELNNEFCRSLDWKMVGQISRALSSKISSLPIFIPTMQKLSSPFISLLELNQGDLDKLVSSFQGMNIKTVGVIFSDEALRDGWAQLSVRFNQKISEWKDGSHLSLDLIESGYEV